MFRNKGINRLPIRGSNQYVTAETVKALCGLKMGHKITQHRNRIGRMHLHVWSPIIDFIRMLLSMLYSATKRKGISFLHLLPWFLAHYKLSCYSSRATTSWLFTYRMKKKNGGEVLSQRTSEARRQCMKNRSVRRSSPASERDTPNQACFILPNYSNHWWQRMVTEEETGSSLIFSTNRWCDFNVEI